jgi:hypothetical protein
VEDNNNTDLAYAVLLLMRMLVPAVAARMICLAFAS